MKRIVLAAAAVMLFVSLAVASPDGDAAVGGGHGETSANTVDVLVSYTQEAAATPVRLLSVPYFGMLEANAGVSKIKSEAGRAAVQIAMAPLWIPAAILHLPQAGLSLVAPGMFAGFISLY